MAHSENKNPPIAHPAPGRFTVGAPTLVISLFGALMSWVLQMELSESVSSHACYPHDVPLSAPLWSWTTGMLIGISAACVLGAGLSAFIAWKSWRKARHHSGNDEHRVIEIGEGRMRFLTMTGALASTLFLVATIFTSCAIILVSPCRSWMGL